MVRRDTGSINKSVNKNSQLCEMVGRFFDAVADILTFASGYDLWYNFPVCKSRKRIKTVNKRKAIRRNISGVCAEVDERGGSGKDPAGEICRRDRNKEQRADHEGCDAGV